MAAPAAVAVLLAAWLILAVQVIHLTFRRLRVIMVALLILVGHRLYMLQVVAVARVALALLEQLALPHLGMVALELHRLFLVLRLLMLLVVAQAETFQEV